MTEKHPGVMRRVIDEKTVALESLDEATWGAEAARDAVARTVDDAMGASNVVRATLDLWRLLRDEARAEGSEGEPRGGARLQFRVRALVSTAVVDALELCDREPLGLARAALETGRQKSLIVGSTEWLDAARNRLTDPALRAIGPSRHRALVALGEAYSGDELRAQRRLDEAEERIDAALEATADESEPAIRSRVLELASEVAAERREFRRALDWLVRAEELVDLARSPASRAEIRLRQGRVFMRRRDFRTAKELLERALEALPPGQDLRLFLEIQHDCLHIAVSKKKLKRADAILEATDILYGDPRITDPLLVAERDRFRGRMALLRDRPADAWTQLLRAADLFLRHRRLVTTVDLLPDLMQAWSDEKAEASWRRSGFRDGALLFERLRRPENIDLLGPVQLRMLAEFADTLSIKIDPARLRAAMPSPYEIN